jgi:glycine cleavage system T protein (aminomethyltransferase)
VIRGQETAESAVGGSAALTESGAARLVRSEARVHDEVRAAESAVGHRRPILTYNRRHEAARLREIMPIGTAVHERTHALCESLNYREWSGYYAVSAYEGYHEHEYNAIRNAAALIDVSPLFKYMITGRDASRFVDRIITRDVAKMSVGQVYYTPWCDERGKVIDDGTVTRLAEQTFRWTAADPSLRWFTQNAAGLDVAIDDISEAVAALALQGPTSARVLRAASDVDIDRLKYFRVATGRIAGIEVDVSRTGYTGDLGYEIWIPARHAVTVWDALMSAGRPHDIKPAGMLALDVARVEAGLLLIDVDFFSSKKAMIDQQRYTPYEMGLGRLVSLEKGRFIGQQALRAEQRRGHARQVVGLEIEWSEVEAIYEKLGLPPAVGSTASRTPVPLYRGGRQIGRATTTTWSPVLKKMIALGTVDRPHYEEGSKVHVEVTVEAVRHNVTATVMKTPFFNPPRKMATPPA